MSIHVNTSNKLYYIHTNQWRYVLINFDTFENILLYISSVLVVCMYIRIGLDTNSQCTNNNHGEFLYLYEHIYVCVCVRQTYNKIPDYDLSIFATRG